MTGITDVTGGDMTCTLAAGNGAVVTIKTGADDFRMIHCNSGYRNPGGRKFLVTGITYITAAYVCRTLAAGCYPIVTSNTVTHKCRMVHRNSRHPGSGSMTVVTL